ncbi:hypothetical protein [uncultured Mailhella sp.]|uniref:hypothetical protein n=1 Tax=uncultured Mailhella sp. TaxID=1981031 RepID=UPI0025F46173|nr:hypothetical protein [uncultured Mailhella sp.]
MILISQYHLRAEASGPRFFGRFHAPSPQNRPFFPEKCAKKRPEGIFFPEKRGRPAFSGRFMFKISRSGAFSSGDMRKERITHFADFIHIFLSFPAFFPPSAPEKAFSGVYDFIKQKLKIIALTYFS